jgi:hypothetical protein
MCISSLDKGYHAFTVCQRGYFTTKSEKQKKFKKQERRGGASYSYAFTYEFLTAKANRTEGSQANKFKRKPLFFLSFFDLRVKLNNPRLFQNFSFWNSFLKWPIFF